MTPSASTPLQQFAECGGYQVAYAVAGEGRPWLVLIPGLPGSARDFRWLAPQLSGWARVVRFDPPGYGSSPRPGYTGMSAVEKARVVSALIDGLEADRVVLVGHSFGSVVAAETVALQPDRVASLVLLAPPGVQAHFPVPVVRTASRALGTAAGRSALRVPQRVAYRAAGFPSFLTDDELAMTTLDSGLADFRSYRAALAAVDRPTMIAYALDDRQVPPRNSAGLHRIAAPGPRVAFASGGHNIQKTRAEELSAFIRSFVTG
jgi:pimeloyl-ACP methyl ester carboxylesterase